MKNNNKRHILMRYAIVVGIMLAFSAFITWDLFKTTVVQAAEWNKKADEVLMDTVAIEPERGKLLADNGTVLAANLQYYVVRIDWFTDGIKEDTLMKDIGPLCDSLARFDSSMTAAEWRQKILGDRKEILAAAKKAPVPVPVPCQEQERLLLREAQPPHETLWRHGGPQYRQRGTERDEFEHPRPFWPGDGP